MGEEEEEEGEEEEEEKGKEVEKEEEGEEEKVAVMVMVKKGTIKEQKSLASKGDAFPMHYRSCYILASSPNIGQKSFGKAEKADFQVPLRETWNKSPRQISTGKLAGCSTEINK